LSIHCFGVSPDLDSFPTRRSSDLGGQQQARERVAEVVEPEVRSTTRYERGCAHRRPGPAHQRGCRTRAAHREAAKSATPTTTNEDRKSTRLNSSHDQISYAVFCLK